MLDIRINGYSADLEPDTAFVLEKRNPMFDFSQLPGPIVLAFSLPVTPRNRRILHYFEHPQAGQLNRKLYCEKYIDSQLIERGYVKLQSYADGKYNLYFTQNLNEAFGDYQQLLLSGIDFGTISIPVPSTAANPLTDPYCWPTIEDTAFYGDKTVSGFTGLMNMYAGSYAAAARVPQLFLRWVLSQYGQKTGWSFGGNFMTDTDLQKLILFNLFSLDGKTSMAYKNHMPDITMPQLLLGLRNLFNLMAEFDVNSKVCNLNTVESVLGSQNVVEWSDKVAVNYTKQPDLQSRLELGFSIDQNDAAMKPIPADLDIYTTPETSANEGSSIMGIRSVFSTLTTNDTSGRAQVIQPSITSEQKSNSNTAILPKLLFWNGMVSGEPRATNAAGSYRLAWHGSNNLKQRFWQKYENFKAGTYLMSRTVYLTPADVARFSYSNKVHIKGSTYLVSNLKLSLKANARLIPAQAELWKV